ncbi:Zinc carboxypeptidase A 1 [Pseudolycoriella hygida]|uniref:Zinc carboxypeptidase A 1 n=1 Tax=Pseudolycoriella hygida TaxID=35572 RepID=A0A9Q0NFV2_9DIPT|nr:Zinc carboxypeptidase A 1 [Pseudolycoriella hygida]
MKTIILGLALLSIAMAIEKARFDNYRVYSINVDTVEQLKELRKLDGNSDGFEFWKLADVGKEADLMVPPHKFADFEEMAQALKLNYYLKIQNVQALIDNENPKTRAVDFDWTSYYTYDEIYEWLDVQLATYPTILSNFVVGESFQNRTIRGVKLAYNEANPSIFIEANIHAREWITSATATWFLNELLTSTDPTIQDLARNINWYIVPIFNVDGFVYSHNVNRLWRKTRFPHAHICYGTDGNRNFGFQWNTIGASSNPCSETFAGPNAWSEPETVHLADYLRGISSEIKIYLSFHSYGQYFLFPYGHTGEHVGNYEELYAVANKTVEAIAVRYGTAYRYGPSSTVLYETSGTSVDWAYNEFGIRLAYTFEFRDRGNYGFVLPADQIIPNGLEIKDGIVAMVAESRVRGIL